MLRSSLSFILVCLVLVGCTQTAEEQARAEGRLDASELLEVDRAFAKLSADSGAVFAFDAYLADNAVQMPQGAAPIAGRDSIVASMVSGPEYALLWVPQYGEIAESGEMGWTWGLYRAIFQTAEGENITSAGKYLNVWRKQDDGSWKVQVDMGNSGT